MSVRFQSADESGASKTRHCRAGAPPANQAIDPPSFHYGATSAVALQLKNAHSLCVSEFQFGGDSSMLFV
jgi:hypothetical protein